jgi:flagellar motor protein MotB
MSQLRRRSRAQSSHADDWLLTYADIITLLLCLFMVLLASQARRLKLIQDPVPTARIEQPVVPTDFVAWKPPFRAVSKQNDAMDDDDAGEKDAAAAPVEREPLVRDSLAAERTTLAAAIYRQSVDPPGSSRADVSLALADTVPNLESAPSSVLPSEIVADVRPVAAARIEQKGDRITTFAFDSAAFFSRGAATLNGSGKVVLLEVISNLNSEDYQDYMITIEGHTDDTPINTAQFPSNWELSTARAAAVVRFFVEQGVASRRVRAAGYADTHPLQPNRDGNGVAIPENQARNRRVVIGLEKIERR